MRRLVVLIAVLLTASCSTGQPPAASDVIPGADPAGTRDVDTEVVRPEERAYAWGEPIATPEGTVTGSAERRESTGYTTSDKLDPNTYKGIPQNGPVLVVTVRVENTSVKQVPIIGGGQTWVLRGLYSSDGQELGTVSVDGMGQLPEAEGPIAPGATGRSVVTYRAPQDPTDVMSANVWGPVPASVLAGGQGAGEYPLAKTSVSGAVRSR